MSQSGFRTELEAEAKSTGVLLGSIVADTAYSLVWLIGAWVIARTTAWLEPLDLITNWAFWITQLILTISGLAMILIKVGENVIITFSRAVVKVRAERKAGNP